MKIYGSISTRAKCSNFCGFPIKIFLWSFFAENHKTEEKPVKKNAKSVNNNNLFLVAKTKKNDGSISNY